MLSYNPGGHAVLTEEPVPSVELSQWWNIDIRANEVDESGIKPNWRETIDLSKVGFSSLSITMLSATFDKVDVKEISLRSIKIIDGGSFRYRGDISKLPNTRNFTITKISV